VIAPIRFYSTRGPHGFLSNFAMLPAPGIWLDGLWWVTTEHYYQAQKVVWPDGSRNAATFARISGARHPGEAARLGRSAPLRPDWRSVREGIMWLALLAKFTQILDLRNRLLATAPAVLIENSPRDAFWGVGADGTGKNRLGAMLMELRDVLARYGTAPFHPEG
jgi:ribA/ribD-fused uncharacterized protein